MLCCVCDRMCCVYAVLCCVCAVCVLCCVCAVLGRKARGASHTTLAMHAGGLREVLARNVPHISVMAADSGSRALLDASPTLTPVYMHSACVCLCVPLDPVTGRMACHYHCHCHIVIRFPRQCHSLVMYLYRPVCLFIFTSNAIPCLFESRPSERHNRI